MLPETHVTQPSDSQARNPDLESFAKLCSVGAAPIPDDLPDDQQRQLLVAVAAIRRKRLINLFASAIAKDHLAKSTRLRTEQMLKRNFDLNKPYNAVIYARMSSKTQNERSPDQQIAEIKRTIKRQNLDWTIQGTYRDDGVKGAHLRKRLGFTRMLDDIYSGAIRPDMILVDTTERFARSTELNTIRQKLWHEYGVLLLTAESSFASPITPAGKVYAAVEAMRSTEENRVKAHQVIRAKRDTIEIGYWPGGRAPRGYVLKKIIKNENGNDEFVGSKLVLDPFTINVDIIKAAFRICIEKGIRGCQIS